jgi:trehalose 6-phosphate phosphatase
MPAPLSPLRPPPPLDRRTALFLDLDGTLAEIAPRPDDVRPLPRRTRTLRSVADALEGRVAVLTGRTLEDADRILDGAAPCVAAIHGLVRRMPWGAVVSAQPSPALAQARRSLQALVDAHEGLLLEDKGASLALHYRQAPAAGPAVRKAAERLALATGLVLQDGAMVAELRTAGPHKGDSLRAYLSHPPFAGARPVMVGDDLTDEDAFAAAEALGGWGVLVGAPRPTRARYGLATVGEVLAWLEQGTAP